MASKPKIKVLLAQIANRNLGDTVIADNTRRLIEACFPLEKRKQLIIIDHNLYTDDPAKIAFADAVVFAGGGLIKFKQEDFYQKTVRVIQEANQRGIPVYMNAVGVECFDPKDERCLLLKETINLPCVKAIRVRDDLDTLRTHYITNPHIAVSSVMDPAIGCPKTYNVKPKKTRSRVIGLGVARAELFADYGTAGIDRSFLLEFWKGVTTELEARGRRWCIFTNGASNDEAFAEEVLAYIGHGNKCAMPAEAEQLVKTLRSFSAVLACRMHSNIIAYSFRVPSVGLIWNDKLAFWGKKIGYPERFLTPEQLSPKTAVDALLRAEKEGCSAVPKEELKRLSDTMQQFIATYAVPRGAAGTAMDYSNHLVACALGGKHLKYKNMNSLATLKPSLDGGFKWLELDIRLTTDGRLVCVNGFGKGTCQALGVDPERYAKGMSYKEFATARYYGTYKTASFADFTKALASHRHNQIQVILDVGRPSAKGFEAILIQLRSSLRYSRLREETFVLRVQRRQDVEAFKKTDLRCRLAYYLPAPEEDFGEPLREVADVAAYCRSRQISLVTMRPETFSPQVAAVLKENGLQSCLLSLTCVSDILEALQNGADLVGSVYTDVKTLTEITQ